MCVNEENPELMLEAPGLDDTLEGFALLVVHSYRVGNISYSVIEWAYLLATFQKAGLKDWFSVRVVRCTLA